MKRRSNSIEVHSLGQIQSLQKDVRDAARLARQNLKALHADPMEALYKLKFEPFGYDPLKGHQLNLIEQLNQSFTVMASLAAAQHLIKWFPHPQSQSGGLRLNLGTASGRDIESIRPNVVAAEVFTAVTPSNNGKLKKDIQRLDGSHAVNRYVFFYAPTHNPGRQHDLEPPGSGVQVWALGQHEIM